jgi:hypothetical protein
MGEQHLSPLLEKIWRQPVHRIANPAAVIGIGAPFSVVYFTTVGL